MTTLSSLGLPDDCYTVRLNQTHVSAKERNQLAIATKITGKFLGAIFGKTGDKDRNDCNAAIALSITSDVSTAVTGMANSASQLEILFAALNGLVLEGLL